MHSEFYSFQFTREELLEQYRALLQRAMVEDQVRSEQGLEPVATRPLIERFHAILRLQDQECAKLEQGLEEETWEHAWYVFTDEWAWYRAKQDVEEELGKRRSELKETDVESLIEQRYNAEFQRYVSEVEMKDALSISKLRP